MYIKNFICCFIILSLIVFQTGHVFSCQHKNLVPVKTFNFTKLSQEYEIAKKTEDTYYPVEQKKKSPLVAFFIALIPGFVIHGLGYTYAGNKKAAVTLGSIELLSIVSFGAGMVLIAVGSITEAVTIGFADTEGNFNLAGTLVIGGIAGFIGTWVIDVIGSPIYAATKKTTVKQLLNSRTFAFRNKTLDTVVKINLIQFEF